MSPPNAGEFSANAGKLKVRIGGAKGISTSFEGKPLACRVRHEYTRAESQFIPVYNGATDWDVTAGFDLKLDSDHWLKIEFFTPEGDIFAVGEHDLRLFTEQRVSVIDAELFEPGIRRKSAALKALFYGDLHFVETPSHLPSTIRISKISMQDPSGTLLTQRVKPFCEIVLGGNIIGRTRSGQSGSDSKWPEVITSDYNGEQYLQLLLKDQAAYSDECLAKMLACDLWELFRSSDGSSQTFDLRACPDLSRVCGSVRFNVDFSDAPPLAPGPARETETVNKSKPSPQDRKVMAAQGVALLCESETAAKAAREAADGARKIAAIQPTTIKISSAAAGAIHCAEAAEESYKLAATLFDELLDRSLELHHVETLLDKLEKASADTIQAKDEAEQQLKRAARLSATLASLRSLDSYTDTKDSDDDGIFTIGPRGVNQIREVGACLD